MERSYARALLLAGLALVGVGFSGFALFLALSPVTGGALAAAVIGGLCLAPVVAVALRGRKAPTVSSVATAADAQVRTMAQAAASSALEGFAGLLDPDKRRK